MNLVKAAIALLRLDTAELGAHLKARWMARTFPYGMDYRDEVMRFNRLYLVPDPWSLDCEREQFRFGETNRLILENFGHSQSLLEIGCGEGFQSSELQKTCNHLYGIDVSERAVRRAEKRCPHATFSVADMYNFAPPKPPSRFDVVTACEVIYFMKNVPRALKCISELGKGCVISYCRNVREEMDKHVKEIPNVQLETVSCGVDSWTLAWWRP